MATTPTRQGNQQARKHERLRGVKAKNAELSGEAGWVFTS
jgi:hypothetical protein